MPPPIFVVGAPRSGTTLLAAMIGSHSHYAIGPETQFFSKLSPATLEQAVDDPEWPSVATDILAALELAGQPVLNLFGATREEIARHLAGRTPSISAMLEALTVPFAVKQGKPGWAEKTPNHLLNLEQIRAQWPEAWIVRIMRDPRDAALSTCRLPGFSNSFAANLYLWRRWQDAAKPFLARDPRTFTMLYESLVRNPEHELGRMCKEIGINFEAGMMNFTGAANHVTSKGEDWKGSVKNGLSVDKVFAWRKSLGLKMQDLANHVTNEYLIQFGYEHSATVKHTRYGYRMSNSFVELNEAFLLGELNRGVRWLPIGSSELADLIVDSPPHGRFRDPRMLARLAYGKLKTKIHLDEA